MGPASRSRSVCRFRKSPWKVKTVFRFLSLQSIKNWQFCQKTDFFVVDHQIGQPQTSNPEKCINGTSNLENWPYPSKMANFGLCGSIYNLHPHIWGYHRVLYFTTQIKEKYSTAMCYVSTALTDVTLVSDDIKQAIKMLNQVLFIGHVCHYIMFISDWVYDNMCHLKQLDWETKANINLLFSYLLWFIISCQYLSLKSF